MRKLEKKFITAGKDKTLIAWDYDERHYKKLHFVSKEVFDKHGIKVKELQSEWPHISAVYVLAPDLTHEERNKFALVADQFKPTFKFKQFALFKGATAYFFSIEYHVPPQFGEFMNFAGDLCGKERIQRFSEDRPHVSLWELSAQEAARVTPDILNEIKEKTKPYLDPFTPTKLSFWDDFQITRIEQLSNSKLKTNYKLAASFKEEVLQYYKIQDNISIANKMVKKLTQQPSFRNRVEAKYAIVEKVKALIKKVAKKTFTALIATGLLLSSQAAFGKGAEKKWDDFAKEQNKVMVEHGVGANVACKAKDLGEKGFQTGCQWTDKDGGKASVTWLQTDGSISDVTLTSAKSGSLAESLAKDLYAC